MCCWELVCEKLHIYFPHFLSDLNLKMDSRFSARTKGLLLAPGCFYKVEVLWVSSVLTYNKLRLNCIYQF